MESFASFTKVVKRKNPAFQADTFGQETSAFNSYLQKGSPDRFGSEPFWAFLAKHMVHASRGRPKEHAQASFAPFSRWYVRSVAIRVTVTGESETRAGGVVTQPLLRLF